jgi:ethanolamine utilization cobalamin adenosyltransferase
MMPFTPLAVNRSERAIPQKSAEPQKLWYEGRLVRTRRGGNRKKDVLRLRLQAREREVPAPSTIVLLKRGFTEVTKGVKD